ncbi:MAG TPA: 23S rRNA (guanosine(2251)-2'-O)-methyltransferase RlmB, partial [Opitutae bacterium]|nr:23S rRNA (guanosine(2251)-2'-O)-methyltransferase RlmB [Opitutae bacterium]
MGRRYSKPLGRRTHSDTQARISTLNEEEALSFLESLEQDPFLLLLDQVQDP